MRGEFGRGNVSVCGGDREAGRPSRRVTSQAELWVRNESVRRSEFGYQNGRAVEVDGAVGRDGGAGPAVRSRSRRAVAACRKENGGEGGGGERINIQSKNVTRFCWTDIPVATFVTRDCTVTTLAPSERAQRDGVTIAKFEPELENSNHLSFSLFSARQRRGSTPAEGTDRS